MIGVSIKKENINKEIIKKYSDMGYKHIEWKWNWDGRGPSPVPDEKELYAVRNICNKYNMTLSIHGPNGISVAEKVEPLRQVSINLWKEVFNAAQNIEALWLVLELGSVGCSSNNFEKKAERAKIAVNSIQEILTCKTGNTKILIENLKKINDDRHCYLGDNYNDILSIINKISNDGVGVIYDTGHAMINAEPLESLLPLEKNISAFHLHVNHGIIDEHLPIDNIMDFKMYKFWDKIYEKYMSNIPIIFEFKPKHDVEYYISIINELRKERE